MDSGKNWVPISEQPADDQRPGRQFIIVEGSSDHSGLSWHRMHIGDAYIRKPGTDGEMLGYRKEDILRICKDGDMDPFTAMVTYWMPAAFPHHPHSDIGGKTPPTA